MAHITRSLVALKWLLPTRAELLGYFIIGLASIALSNLKSIEQVLLLPEDFSFRQAILNSIGTVVDYLLGAEVSSTLITAIFWSLIGVAAYLLIWLISNFSAEVRTSLVSRQALRPKGTDANHALKEFVEHSLFRIASTIVLLFYINTLIQVLLPLWAGAFKRLAQYWPELVYIRGAILMLLVEMVALHVIVVLLRLSLLRKRVFS